MDIIGTRKVFFTLLATFLIVNCFEFYYGFISLEYNDLGVSEKMVGVFFAAESFAQLIYSLSFHKVQGYFPRSFGFFLGIFFSSFLLLIMSRPSNLIPVISNSWQILLLGQILIPIGVVLIMIPSFEEMI